MKEDNMKKRKTTMNKYVPPEIVREIFLNLPCKSLCTFRSICKQHRSQIDDLQFIEEHRKQNMKASHLLTWDTTNRSNLHMLKMSMDGYTHTKVISTYKYEFVLPSSYGMACLHGWKNKKIALFNPLSEEIIPLPDMREPFAYETKNKPCAPTPTEWRRDSLGFGFDPKSRRYKIIHLIERCGTISRLHVLTVTLNGSSWRTVRMSNKPLGIHFRYQPVCVDGVLYWEIWDTDPDIYVDVFAFDLSTEETNIIQSPAIWRGDIYGNGGHLVSLGGELCCYEMVPPTDMLLTMIIWKLEYDANNNIDWTLRYKLQIGSINWEICPLVPLYLYGDKRIMFQDEFLNEFYYYDIEDKSLNIYPMNGKVEGFPDPRRLIVHSETMANPLG